MNDSERFKFGKLGLEARIAMAVALYAAGAAIQVLLGDSFWPGAVAVVLGWCPIMLKRVSNKPKDQGKEEWRPVGMAEMDRLLDTLRASKKVRSKFLPAAAGKTLFTVLAVLVVGGSYLVRKDVGLAALDGFLFLVPALFIGGVSVFVPRELDMKLSAFAPILGDDARPPEFVLVPYLRFDEDENGKDVPEDVRFMIELKRAPADFVGIQFQVAINQGPNGAVPYMYAVVITKADGPTGRLAAEVTARGFVVEAGGEGEYRTVVVRQETDNGGYHTSPADVRELYAVMTRIALRCATSG